MLVRAQLEVRSPGKISCLFSPQPYCSYKPEVIGIGHVKYYAKGLVGYGKIMYHNERNSGFLVL